MKLCDPLSKIVLLTFFKSVQVAIGQWKVIYTYTHIGNPGSVIYVAWWQYPS